LTILGNGKEFSRKFFSIVFIKTFHIFDIKISSIHSPSLKPNQSVLNRILFHPVSLLQTKK